MSKPRDDCKRALGVATAVCLVFGWMACGHPDPLIDHSGGNGSTAGVVLPAGTGAVVPVGGTGSLPAGQGGVAGTGAVAGIGVVSAGSPSPAAGVGAAMGGTGAAVVPLPPFDAGSDPNRNRVTPGVLCSRLAVIDCAGESHCCNNPGRTVNACRADVMMTCSSTLYVDELAMNPITGFDQDAALAAYTTLEQKASMCDSTVAVWGGSATGLRGILKGTIAPNGNCKPTSGNLQDKATAGAALASCTGIATTACLPKSALGQWTCAPKNASGGACVTDNNCKDGLYCNLPPMNFLGKCSARQAVGTSCSNTTPNQCESLFCKGGKCVAADQQAAYCLAAN